MEFAGFGHVTLTVSNYDACLKFYDCLMKAVAAAADAIAKGKPPS